MYIQISNERLMKVKIETWLVIISCQLIYVFKIIPEGAFDNCRSIKTFCWIILIKDFVRNENYSQGFEEWIDR